MMKRVLLIILVATVAPPGWAGGVGNFSIGLGPMGNFFFIDARPDLEPGVGGNVFFDYRWSPQLSTTVSIFVTTEDGEGPDAGDNSIEWLGMPTFDIKYYFLSSPSKWDPFAQTGVGMYVVTEGSRNNGTFAMGLGAQVGIGTDYYLTERLSLGTGMQYRSIGLIESWGGGGKGLFLLSFTGYASYHF